MSPQNSPHATTIRAVNESLRKVFVNHYDIRVQMPLALGPSSEPEPDVAVITGSYLDYKNEHPKTAVLVVEVSDTPLAFDRGEKASLYAKAGIPEYWIANLPERRVEVRREPVLMPDQPYGYGYRVTVYVQVFENISPLAAPKTQIAVSDLLP